MRVIGGNAVPVPVPAPAPPALGVRHAESNGIINAYLSGNSVYTTGDGRSSGSIQLYAGVWRTTATIGGVAIAGSTVQYFAAQTPVRVGPASGFQRLGSSKFYYNPRNVRITCAWQLTTCIGHEKNPGPPLTLGQGLARWEQTKAQYGLTIPVMVLYLP